MQREPRKKTILEFLTCENPRITLVDPASKSNTSSKKYRLPKQLRYWEEFSIETLKDIYDKSLFLESQLDSHALPDFPTYEDEYCEVNDEASTREIITIWTRSIVNSALKAVEKSFCPALWVKGKKIDHSWGPRVIAKFRMQPSRSCNSHKRKQEKKGGKFRPDGGAISTYGPVKLAGQEMLPKEYKPASKWKSSDLETLLNDDGTWNVENPESKVLAKPVGQIYSYCVTSRCRYGCILTTDEAFIFQIKPRNTQHGTRFPIPIPERISFINSKLENRNDSAALDQCLVDDGLMEYVSIPWGNHRNGVSPEESKHWTVNLALWFIHILAGNNHQVNWDYGKLSTETLRQSDAKNASSRLEHVQDGQLDNQLPELKNAKPESQGRKRRRLNQGSETQSSFIGSQLLDSQVSLKSILT